MPTLIGTNPDQVPTNGDLGSMAFQDAEAVTVKTLSVSNINITTLGARITGDFSNATVANRVLFQTSTVNGNTNIGIMPNGTAFTSGFRLYGGSDVNNSTIGQMLQAGSTETQIRSDILGTGTYAPMTFYTGGFERMRIDTSGNALITGGGNLGYGTGSGGTVTQATSKSTAVTLNKPTGRITMNNSALAAGATASFIVNNSIVSAQDTVIVNNSGGGNSDSYSVRARIGAGIFVVSVTNTSASSFSDSPIINFAVIEGSPT